MTRCLDVLVFVPIVADHDKYTVQQSDNQYTGTCIQTGMGLYDCKNQSHLLPVWPGLNRCILNLITSLCAPHFNPFLSLCVKCHGARCVLIKERRKYVFEHIVHCLNLDPFVVAQSLSYTCQLHLDWVISNYY